MYGEKRISVEGEKEGEKIEYRVWNPFRYVRSTQSLISIVLVSSLILPMTLLVPHRLTMVTSGAGRSWQHRCWLAWTTSTSSLDARSSILEQPPAPQSAMCQTLWAPLALSTPWSSPTAVVSHVCQQAW